MSQLFIIRPFGAINGVKGFFPSTIRGKTMVGIGGIISRGKLATDSLFDVTLVIMNGVLNSRYRIEVSSTGSLVAEGTISSDPQNITVPYFGGTSSDTLTIKIRKGTSAPKYRPFETQAVLSASGATVYAAQIADSIA